MSPQELREEQWENIRCGRQEVGKTKKVAQDQTEFAATVFQAEDDSDEWEDTDEEIEDEPDGTTVFYCPDP